METFKNSTVQNTEMQLTLFQEASHAKTFQLVKRQRRLKKRESEEKEQDFGINTLVLLGKLDLKSSSLKTAQCCLVEDLKQSYATFTSSGIMLNGDCFMLPNSDFRTSEKDFTELPTPAASDAKILLKKVESYKKYYQNKHQDKALYQFHLHGFTANQAMKMYEWMMGFPKNWIKDLYTDLEMQ